MSLTVSTDIKAFSFQRTKLSYGKMEVLFFEFCLVEGQCQNTQGNKNYSFLLLGNKNYLDISQLIFAH